MKWFDTNYHYIVPEFEADQSFHLASTQVIDQFEEAQHVGVHTRPVLVEPVSFLLLGKAQRDGLNLLDLLDDLLPVYAEVLVTRRKGHALILEAIEQALDVRFIELMPFQGNAWSKDRFVPWREMKDRMGAVLPAFERVEDGPHATSRTYRVGGWKGTVGFIASMTAPFCAGCNRLRLTADGYLKVCLFGKAETNLRDPMRAGASDEELGTIISDAVYGKKTRHAGMDLEAARAGENRPMITIGG